MLPPQLLFYYPLVPFHRPLPRLGPGGPGDSDRRMTVKVLVPFETMLSRGALPVIALTLALVAMPLASAQISGFGYRVTDDDGTARVDLESGGPGTLTYLDADGDGRPDTGDSIYLTVSSSTTAANDIRLDGGDGAAGAQIRGSDDDAGRSVEEIDGDLAFHDLNGNGDFERNETLFWDRDDTNSDEVSIGDIILSGEDAGQPVPAGYQYLQRNLATISGDFGHVDEDDSNSYSAGDLVYIDVRDSGYVDVPDIRIGVPSPYALGSMVRPGDDGASIRLLSTDAPTEFVYLDDDGDERYDGNEPAYLSRSTTRVLSGAIRLAQPLEGDIGSLVRSGESDQGLTITTLDGDLEYADNNGDNDLDEGDVLYYDLDQGTSNEADGNDLILSGPDAGDRVGAASGHHGSELDGAPGSIRFVDVDGDASYSVGDMVYLDADNDGFVSSGDVQLTRHQPLDAPEPTDTDGDGVPDDEDACPSQAADTSDGCPADTGDGSDDGGDGTDGGDSDALQEAREAQQDAQEAQRAAQDALDAANEAKRISEENSELIGQVLDRLNETGQNGSPGPGLVLALIGLAGAALALGRRR